MEWLKSEIHEPRTWRTRDCDRHARMSASLTGGGGIDLNERNFFLAQTVFITLKTRPYIPWISVVSIIRASGIFCSRCKSEKLKHKKIHFYFLTETYSKKTWLPNGCSGRSSWWLRVSALPESGPKTMIRRRTRKNSRGIWP